jgi:hypothetical protein
MLENFFPLIKNIKRSKKSNNIYYISFYLLILNLVINFIIKQLIMSKMAMIARNQTFSIKDYFY